MHIIRAVQHHMLVLEKIKERQLNLIICQTSKKDQENEINWNKIYIKIKTDDCLGS